MQNDIDIFRGIKSEIQKNPENYKPAGQWFDDFCQDIVNQAEQDIQKLPQIKSDAFREIKNKKSLLKNIQHKEKTLRKIIAGHEHNDEKFKEEKQRLSKLHAKAYQLALEVQDLGRELKNIESKSQDKPGFIQLILKAFENSSCEYPPDYRKIMLIAWLMTDKYLHLSKLGITKYEQYVFNNEVREPEGNGPKRLVSEQELAKDAVLARPGAMEKIRDACLSYKGLLSGESIGKPGDTKRKKARKKTPPQLLKEARERQAAQELAKDPNLTAKILGEILGCDKSTVVRLKAWQKKNVLNSPLPKGFIKRTEDENYSTVEAINKPE